MGAQSHQHSHGEGAGHGHHHAPPTSSRAFAIAVALNLGFVAIEVVAGIAGRSMALISDAAHNLSDVLSLLLAWGATWLARRPAGPGFTYGFKSSSILAALANAALLWVALGAILVETVQRLANPEPAQGWLMIWVAAAGIGVNAASAALFAAGRKGDLNVGAAFTHLLADAAVSAGVVVAGAAVLLTGAALIDPIASLVITLVIGWGSWGLLKDTTRLALAAVPRGIDEHQVRGWLQTRPGVHAVHHLHIWAVSTTQTALTAHLVVPGGADDGFLATTVQGLSHEFRIDHATLQLESGSGCATAAEKHC
ncbi:cation diffusion facilitator family transporter [Parablastomonas sp. CN1-191]|uniref:cation diffusion facilitator family transporter n=1 Tax=Parablastomonas sp. CN1-191 TaxID=3400908 RepID=UPI003BF91FA7